MTDKFAKLNFGAYAARSLAPAYYMAVDADDRVSNRLAQFVQDSPSVYGWYFDYGYLHKRDSKSLSLTKNFNLLCGSSSILRCQKEDLPSSPDRRNSTPSLIHLGHTVIRERMNAMGRPLTPLPFPGAVYETGTGENDSGISTTRWGGSGISKLAQRFWQRRRLDSRRASEFGYR
jgi:hypothetical protein